MQIANTLENQALFGQIWTSTPNDRYGGWMWRCGPGYMTDEQKMRWERLRQAQLLFDGRHRQYFLTESRTQFDFPPSQVNGSISVPYVVVNLLQLISIKGADLLFGQAPILRVDDPIQQSYLSALAHRCQLHSLLHCAAADCSYEAETFLKARIYRGQVYIEKVCATAIYPEGPLMPDFQYQSYVCFRTVNVGTEKTPILLLLTERYLPGLIERHCYQLNDASKIQMEIGLRNWPGQDAGSPMLPVESTGIERNLITVIPNAITRGMPTSDYDGAIELQDCVNAKETQLARVIARHTDPTLAVPINALDERGNLSPRQRVFVINQPDQVPQYITYDGQIEMAARERDTAVDHLIVKAEFTPSLLGLRESAAPEAYQTLRIRSFPAISKSRRKAAYFKQGILRVVETAQELEQTIPGVRYDRYPIACELRDGLPSDPTELANMLATLKAARLISRRRALEIQLIDRAAVDKEMLELEREDRESMPTIFGGDPLGDPKAETKPEREYETEGDGSGELPPDAADLI